MVDTLVERRKKRVALLSVSSNTLLVLLKLVVGLFIGSVSVISEAVHSSVDLLAAIIAYLAVRTSTKPADEAHPFGHGKIENVSGAVEALLIFAAAVWIIYEAVNKLLHPHPLESVGWGVLIMLVSAAMNLFVSHRLFVVGKETDSVALQADAWHLRTDVYTSAGVMAGLALIVVGGWVFPGTNLYWIDPVAAIAVALLIMRTAYGLTLHATRDLLDASLPADEKRWIREHVTSFAPRVRGFHRLRTRKAGPARFVEFHLLVEATMTVEQSHALAETIETDIEERFPGSSVSIHVEPCDGTCDEVCLDGCLVEDEERAELQCAAQGRPPRSYRAHRPPG